MFQKLFAPLVLILFVSISCTSLQPTTSDRCLASGQCETVFTNARNQMRSEWPLPAQFAQHPSFISWAQNKREEIKNLDHNQDTNPDVHFNVPEYLEIKPRPILVPAEEARKRITDTTQLYHSVIGQDSISSLIWTGIESGNPLTRHEEYRWNSLREQGMYDADKRAKFISQLLASGIKNIRMGMSNHEIDPDVESSWHDHDLMMADFAKAGIRVSLDMHHFGIEDKFRVKDANGNTIGEKSYYLNPAWPDYFAHFAAKAYARYHNQIKAITIMNEPETVAGFNGEMWHGGFPGWSSPQKNFYYLERAIAVAKASVKARIAIEAEARKIYGRGARPLYVHTEAGVHKEYWPDFNNMIRFIISDLILGNDWLVHEDLNALAKAPMDFDPARPDETKDAIVGRWHRKSDADHTIMDWIVENYIVYSVAPENREANRQRLVKILSELQNLHRDLKTHFGKTMRTDTTFAVDYYAHNEDKDKDGNILSPEPQYYGTDVKSGMRAGLYPLLVDYFNHFQMPLSIGESGTVYYYYGARWNEQMLLECASAAEAGIPFLGYIIYPAIDTYGWESALSVPRSQALFNPSGIVDLQMQPKYFVGRMMQSLKAKMKP